MKVKTPESQGYLLEIAKGMAVTMRHLLKRDIATISYPEEKRQYSGRFRGKHILTRWADGRVRCTSCFCCQTACPADCIDIVAGEVSDPTIEKAPEQFNIDFLRCVFCGLCVEACPKEALVMSKRSELGMVTHEGQISGIEDLMARDELKTVELGARPYYTADKGSGEPVCIGPGKDSPNIVLHGIADK